MSDTAQLGYATIGRQAAKGTAATDLASNGVLLTGMSVGVDAPVEDSDAEIDGTRDLRPGSSRFGGASVSGDLEGHLRFALLPIFLASAGFTFAAPVEIGAGSGAYRHTGTLSQSTAPSWMTVETRWGTAAVRRFVDCLVDELTFSAEADGDVDLSASIRGIRELWQGSSTAVTYPANNARATSRGSAVTFDGLGTYRWASTELSISNNASDDEFVIGSRLLDDVTLGMREILLSGTIRLGNNTPSVTDLYRAAVYGSKTGTDLTGQTSPFETSAAVTFGSDRLIGTSGTERYRAVFTLPTVVLRGFPLEGDGDDVLEASIEARALGTGVTVDVYNARSTAY